jgi:hypothetical protein
MQRRGSATIYPNIVRELDPVEAHIHQPLAVLKADRKEVITAKKIVAQATVNHCK